MTRYGASHRGSNPYSRVRSGRREDLNNQFFRSSWEANFARYLNFLIENGDIAKWEYEPERFEFEAIKRGTRSYMPDFKVWDTPESKPYYYEVKGWMDAKSKTKLKRMAKYYPDITVLIFGQKEYKSLERTMSALIPYWE
jgi:predicted nuclease of restriction endonuclease-like RecB superfamily